MIYTAALAYFIYGNGSHVVNLSGLNMLPPLLLNGYILRTVRIAIGLTARWSFKGVEMHTQEGLQAHSCMQIYSVFLLIQ